MATRTTANRRAKPCKSYFVSSGDGVAQFFGVSPRTAHTWRMGRDFPAKTKRGYDLQAVAAWVVASYQKKRQGSHGGNGSGAAEDRLKLAKAELAELTLSERRSQLIESDIVSRVMSRYVTIAKTILLGLPDAVSVLLPEGLRASLRPKLVQTTDEMLTVLGRIPNDLDKEFEIPAEGEEN